MKLRLALCAAVLLSACNREPEAPDDAGAETNVAAEKRLPLPDCSETETQDAGADGWIHPDCRMMLTDVSGLAIEARYAKAEDESTKVSVQVVAPGDATLQTIEETMGNTFNGITQQDIDQDGRHDLLIPLETGNANTTWAVWRQKEDGRRFARIGEPSGVSIEKTASGYIVAPSRSSASDWTVSFFLLEGDALQPVATATVVAEGELDKISGVSCTVIDEGGLSAVGLSPEAAQAQFCAEPAVAGIFK